MSKDSKGSSAMEICACGDPRGAHYDGIACQKGGGKFRLAEARGPKFVETAPIPAPVKPAPRQAVEALAAARKTPARDFALAKAHERWAVGQLVTEADFDAAVMAACGVSLR